MTPFLRQIASFYKDETDLENYCFVFPNRRSGQFFEKELSALFQSPHMMPRVLTMAEWLEELNEQATASTVEMLFTLFQAYSESLGDSASSFDRFIFWAHIILNDFNDLDMAMADARQLYTNLSDLREIATDYIDAELKTEISRVFNLQFSAETPSFWKKYHPEKDTAGSPSEQYYTLWQKLSDIYERFHQLLNERGLTTQAHLMRHVADHIDWWDTRWLGYDHFVMVGFASLSVSEDRIFKSLKQKGIAHFWWDDASPVFDATAPGANESPCSRLINTYSKRYPSPQALE